MYNPQYIRNFCIVAHIDHGKSTLSDRLIEKAGIIDARKMRAQMTDDMDIERERGITIKSHAVRLPYKAKDGNEYILNFVDTPGHVDFSYEVSRSIASCEGAILVIDASQGVESQTLSNMYLALEHDLEILPVINKIDLPASDIEMCKNQIDKDLGLDSTVAVPVSAKTGQNIDLLFEAIIKNFNAPLGSLTNPLQALIFDSNYDPYRGVIVQVRVFEGEIKEGATIRFMNSNSEYKVEEVGYLMLDFVKTNSLKAGEVGYIIAGIKTISDVRVGDTITDVSFPCKEALAGFKMVKPVVFSSVYPTDTNDYEALREAFEKLKLNDASLTWEKDSSVALGHGFRCGFLGLLHLEIVQERLEREFDQSVIFTAPSVMYSITLKNGDELMCDNPANYPEDGTIAEVREPYIKATIITPTTYLGNIMSLCIEKRGTQTNMNYLDEKRVEVTYEMPLSEVLFEFYDRLKSISRGFASFDYDVIDSRATDIVKVDILLNGKPVDALAQLLYRPSSYDRSRVVCEKLKDEIPRQLFKIPIQASIGSQVIARETISALRKDVLAKCYGGDITRKRKLLEKQKEGKKRMKMVGDVEIPQSAFLAVLKHKE
ncbi:MAG: translation elongation factor 4 [Treponema sp.]